MTGKLTDDDLTKINGQREQLEGIIEQRYGLPKDMVRKDIDAWLNSLTETASPTSGTAPAHGSVGALRHWLRQSELQSLLRHAKTVTTTGMNTGTAIPRPGTGLAIQWITKWLQSMLAAQKWYQRPNVGRLGTDHLRKRELRALLLSEKFKEADMISHIPQIPSDWLVELSLAAVMGLPPKDPDDDDDENEEDEEDDDEEQEESVIREPDE